MNRNKATKINVADELAPFFSGDKQLDETVAKVVLLF
mgnify:CR=1 FL=1|jgi:hypothetical protein